MAYHLKQCPDGHHQGDGFYGKVNLIYNSFLGFLQIKFSEVDKITVDTQLNHSLFMENSLLPRNNKVLPEIKTVNDLNGLMQI